jgi:DNA processing protein
MKLVDLILEKGAVISEFPPGTEPEPRNFPVRNRIISGLCAGVVVVEAARKSGSLVTASIALEQGREVMAVPGSIFSFQSVGAHWLISQGATLVTSVSDIEECIGFGANRLSVKDADERGVDMSSLSPDERRVVSVLSPYPLHIDDIASACGMSIIEVSAILVQLELEDIVVALPGQKYCLGVQG